MFPMRSNELACGRQVVEEWKRCCDRLAAHIQPNVLELKLNLDTADTHIGSAMLRTLSALPILKECSVAFEMTSSRELQPLTERTVRQVTGQIVSCPPFRFEDLPIELQLKILEYAGLSAPGDLRWLKGIGYILNTCAEMACGIRGSPAIRYIGCHIFRARYNSGDPCWTFPASLFLVNCSIRELSQHVFFSKNRFLHPHHDDPLGWYLPQSCLHLIRFISFSFSYLIDLKDYAPGSSSIALWIDRLDYITRHLNVSNLVLSLYLECTERSCGQALDVDVENRLQHDVAMPEVYKRIIEPLTRIKGLKDLFVHMGRRGRQGDFLNSVRDKQEAELEQVVMGPLYDAVARGKYWSRPPSPICRM
ncbi:hypothetical protein CPC735_023350 [Coccidioides posadasii C735 delta SOWgp]|uniref:Uncharacterized protein n=1 Tax=Coccidioides posadasii (strain C735) TaxID=222929 RepID=C5P6E9_COCP7|nr:hypothetical protein CPC735_023350 [Coccidioides posadasii C735 delta SOWgp]EER26999.1 hypothetical protein CPC735_023350 [Coccidioides posadasii C735 delta SOWgp]|eukprot:XP_003069144.1 hypothetical protein CPC735_023350 [Coccidioides posadasii C735 delta SOWgp]